MQTISTGLRLSLFQRSLSRYFPELLFLLDNKWQSKIISLFYYITCLSYFLITRKNKTKVSIIYSHDSLRKKIYKFQISDLQIDFRPNPFTNEWLSDITKNQTRQRKKRMMKLMFIVYFKVSGLLSSGCNMFCHIDPFVKSALLGKKQNQISKSSGESECWQYVLLDLFIKEQKSIFLFHWVPLSSTPLQYSAYQISPISIWIVIMCRIYSISTSAAYFNLFIYLVS